MDGGLTYMFHSTNASLPSILTYGQVLRWGWPGSYFVGWNTPYWSIKGILFGFAERCERSVAAAAVGGRYPPLLGGGWGGSFPLDPEFSRFGFFKLFCIIH